jgi:hypothetical protein
MDLIDRCEFRGRLAGAAVVVCPPGLADDALRLIGRTACQGAERCTAWFWDDPTLAPETPPTVEQPMTAAQAEAVVAIYIADTSRLWRAGAEAHAPCELDDTGGPTDGWIMPVRAPGPSRRSRRPRSPLA